MLKIAYVCLFLLLAGCKNFDLSPDENCGVLNNRTTRKTITGRCYYREDGKKVFVDKKYCPC